MGFRINRNTKLKRVKYVYGETEQIGYLRHVNEDGNLKEIEVDEGVVKIWDNAFKDCDSLTTVTLPSSLKRIERNSFVGCISLQKIVFPKSLKKVNFGLDTRGVSKMTLLKPSSDDLIKNLQKGYAMDLCYEGDFEDDHWD